jgi:hypothetical protein
VLIACVLPPVAAISLLVTAYAFGWAFSALHTIAVAAIVLVMIEIAACAIPFVPFTRVYQPGRAKLRTRWWLYVVGTYASAIWPIWFERWALDHPPALVAAIAACAALAAGLDVAGRRRSLPVATSPSEDEAAEVSGFTVLDIGMPVHGGSQT